MWLLGLLLLGKKKKKTAAEGIKAFWFVCLVPAPSSQADVENKSSLKHSMQQRLNSIKSKNKQQFNAI